MEDDIFAIHVPVEFFDRALADKVDLRVNYFDPLYGEVIVELDQDFTLDYYKKFFLDIVSNNENIKESYNIPVGLERVKNGLNILSVDDFLKKQAAEKVEAFFDKIDINGETEEVLVISFSKEIIIKALLNEEIFTIQVGNYGEIIVNNYQMQEILSEPLKTSYVNLIFRKKSDGKYEFFGILVEPDLDSGQLKTEIKKI